jgi:hypothetical protein
MFPRENSSTLLFLRWHFLNSPCLFRLSAITKRFFLEIEQKDFFSKKMVIAEFLIPHLRSLKFDNQSAEGIKNAVSFLDPINKNWKEWTKKGRLRLAFSLMLGGVLQPLVTMTQIPGVNYADWDAALKSLYAATTAAAKKDKKSWQMLPLEVPLVSLQSADLFYQNLEALTEAIHNNIKVCCLFLLSLKLSFLRFSFCFVCFLSFFFFLSFFLSCLRSFDA